MKQRLLRNQERLFTFVEHNGVAWHNNFAEHAIKRFASYRQQTDGMLKREGLNEYLTLLSVCETCRLRGLNFLEFLSSGECDTDRFWTGKRRTRCTPCMDLYPEDYVPTRLAGLQRQRVRQRQSNRHSGLG